MTYEGNEAVDWRDLNVDPQLLGRLLAAAAATSEVARTRAAIAHNERDLADLAPAATWEAGARARREMLALHTRILEERLATRLEPTARAATAELLRGLDELGRRRYDDTVRLLMSAAVAASSCDPVPS
jgi:hypothetical protein